MDRNDFKKAIEGIRLDATFAAERDLESFVKGYQNIGAILSKGYMTMITVGDTYGEAK
jgi:hypothetical protein